MAQVFQQGAIGEIGSCLVRGQQDLKDKDQQCILKQPVLLGTGKNLFYPSLAHLDIPVCFSEDHFDKLGVLQSVQKVGVETVKVGLDADAFHHQVL